MIASKARRHNSPETVAGSVIVINLLDWRKTVRQQRRRAFLGALAVAMLLPIGIITAGALHYYSWHIGIQLQRNAYLQQQIETARQKGEALAKILAVRTDIVHRLRIIHDLQQARSRIVRYFNTITDTIPDGVALLSLQQNEDTTTLQGLAKSNARVSDYMLNLDNSVYLQDPRLVVIKSTNRNGQRYARFTLLIRHEQPGSQSSDTAVPAQP